MKKLYLGFVLIIITLLNSCIQDIIEDTTKLNEPVVAEANIDGSNFISVLGSAQFTIYQDNSYGLSMTFTNIDDLTDVLKDIHTLALFAYGSDFNNFAEGTTYSEHYRINPIDENNLGGFFGVYWYGDILSEDINYAGISNPESGTGIFKITSYSTTNKTFSGTFNFTTYSDEDYREVSITNGKIIDVEFDIEYSDIESINNDN